MTIPVHFPGGILGPIHSHVLGTIYSTQVYIRPLPTMASREIVNMIDREMIDRREN